MRPVTPIEERILRKVDVGLCWEWTGQVRKNTAWGYGVINRGRKGEGTVYVHRALYEALVGPIPEGLMLDHLCRVRRCCNPDHLEPVTIAENVARGRYAAGIQRVTQCKWGHEYTPENTGRSPGRNRYCLTCAAAYNRAYRLQRKAS